MPSTKQLHYTKFSLNKELEDVVKYGWIMKSTEVAPSPLDLLIPDGFPEIIFVLNGAYCKDSVNADSETIVINKSCFVGIQSQSVFASRIDNCHLVGLKLYPWVAYRLFGAKLKEAADKNIYLESFGVKWLGELDQHLHSSQEEARMIELVNNTLCDKLKEQNEDESWQIAASYLRTILEMGGQISVQELAKTNCVSTRHFQRKFKQYYGISPKKFINIIRFKELYKSSVLQKKLPDNFLEFGYYDQMHFIKDFRKQLGITPSKATDQAFLRLNEMAKKNA